MTMTQSPPRAIIEDFAPEITRRKTSTAKPSKTVIDFRNEKSDGVEREIFNVPLELLRFRKDNGRIASDVLSFEHARGPLSETDMEAQNILGEFLKNKDPEKTEELYNSIYAGGQDQPAIVTCDGFLIDGNRRLLVLEKLSRDHPSDSRFQTMKVVLLPGPGDEGGPPTLLEIEKIENRYQLQKDGKAEYYGFDAALSIRQKEQRGFPLEDQMRDDAQFRALPENKFRHEVKKKRQKLLAPLKCIDRYLSSLGRPELYNCISRGLSDREGRWQAFIDYSDFYSGTLQNDRKRQELGIDESEVGDIEDAAFKIIRLRDLSGIEKVHAVMRDMPKLCKHGKKEILAISDKVKDDIADNEKYDDKGEPRSIDEIDKIWAASERQEIIHRVKKSMNLSSQRLDKEPPMTLLRAALKKLEHDDMDLSAIGASDYDQASQLARDIQKVAKEIGQYIYEAQKKLRRLTSKK